MAFTLPDLPFAKDALAPFMSAETLEFHHGTLTDSAAATSRLLAEVAQPNRTWRR